MMKKGFFLTGLLVLSTYTWAAPSHHTMTDCDPKIQICVDVSTDLPQVSSQNYKFVGNLHVDSEDGSSHDFSQQIHIKQKTFLFLAQASNTIPKKIMMTETIQSLTSGQTPINLDQTCASLLIPIKNGHYVLFLQGNVRSTVICSVTKIS